MTKRYSVVHKQPLLPEGGSMALIWCSGNMEHAQDRLILMYSTENTLCFCYVEARTCPHL